VIIAGDTNLPGASWVLCTTLDGYADAFAEAGAGFGYTFPAGTGEQTDGTRSNRVPWMRLDRVLTNDAFRPLAVRVVPTTVSDHGAVVADLELLRPEPGGG
jgi:endonuclease/exonuclease/phosphatase family metal-dependent hydrolase